MKKLRIIYAGTPEFSVPALKALIASEYDVVAVYTQPDRPSGRGRKITFSPVKQTAIDAGIQVEQPLTLKDEEAQKVLAAYNADVMIVAAYSLMLPQIVLDTPTHGCLNIHGSLLPRWRGAAPIHRAIQAGDTETGVTIMQMAAGLDTGDMLLKSHCPITPQDTGASIHDRLASDGADALMTVLNQLVDGKMKPEVQDDALSTYAHKLEKAEAEIDWTHSAVQIDRTIRAFNLWPVAFTKFNDKTLRLFMSKVETDKSSDEPIGTVIDETPDGISIVTGDGVLSFSRLQLQGKKTMDVRDFLNGRSLLDNKLPS